jgi:hypothetical protein
MSEIKDRSAAFPRFVPDGHYNGSIDEEGMLLRDYLAAHASIDNFDIWTHVQEMRAERATYTDQEASVGEIADAIADLKYEIADAMLKRRQS